MIATASGQSDTRAAPAMADRERVRAAVRTLLTSATGFERLSEPDRVAIAHALVKIGTRAQELERTLAEESARPRREVARALDAGQRYSGVATDRIADTTRRILNAVSFPRFVNELLTGVFRALNESNQQQIQAYVDLVKAVAATTDGYADANVSLDAARRWLAERFPANFAIESLLEPGDEPEEGEPTVELRLRPGMSMPTPAALRAGLQLGPDDALPEGGHPESLLPMVKAALARNRQQMLATMVMLGMQRIVIDSGRIHAAMRFHIDTRSAAAEQSGSTFDVRNEIAAEGGFSLGPWSASAAVRNTIGYVSTQAAQTSEETNTDLELNSSVELVFKTDYVPLDRLATGAEVNRIRVNTLNPNAESSRAADERRARADGQRAREAEARQQLGTVLTPREGTTLAPAQHGAASTPNTPAARDRPAASNESAAPGAAGGAAAGGGAAGGAAGGGSGAGGTAGGGSGAGGTAGGGSGAGGAAGGGSATGAAASA